MSFDHDFWEKVILLVLTAMVTGLGVPYILRRIEERRHREQKRFEAELARQNNIITAQAKLLEDLSRIVWRWRYLAKQVCYYAGDNAARYETAKQQYDEGVWDILHRFRIAISRSRRLVSEQAFGRLNALYSYVVHDVDGQISELIQGDEIDPDLARQISKRFSDEVSARLDDALDELAAELKLKVKA